MPIQKVPLHTTMIVSFLKLAVSPGSLSDGREREKKQNPERIFGSNRPPPPQHRTLNSDGAGMGILGKEIFKVNELQDCHSLKIPNKISLMILTFEEGKARGMLHKTEFK